MRLDKECQSKLTLDFFMELSLSPLNIQRLRSLFGHKGEKKKFLGTKLMTIFVRLEIMTENFDVGTSMKKGKL